MYVNLCMRAVDSDRGRTSMGEMMGIGVKRNSCEHSRIIIHMRLILIPIFLAVISITFGPVNPVSAEVYLPLCKSAPHELHHDLAVKFLEGKIPHLPDLNTAKSAGDCRDMNTDSSNFMVFDEQGEVWGYVLVVGNTHKVMLLDIEGNILIESTTIRSALHSLLGKFYFEPYRTFFYIFIPILFLIGIIGFLRFRKAHKK